MTPIPSLYCNSLTNYSRLSTREVKAGELGIGGKNPVRIQSMTTTDTMDTSATVAQSIRMIEAGCELVRITAPSIHEAKNLLNIKNALLERGYKIPISADIHFTPNAAEAAARIVEKVRINPGNYADRKKFEHIEYTEAAYDSELQRIRDRFLPLIKICKEYGTAMRIGTNHGSLSDRILSRYGDTPLGMVESALEFLRICENENYHHIVLSMKASNPQVMVQAYRLLIVKMQEAHAQNVNSTSKDLPWAYPLHLGVTEAGEGEDGRIKSAVGIGALLEDGIGDTIRVSLTEDPEFEIPVAKMLVERYGRRTELQKPISEMYGFSVTRSAEIVETESQINELSYSPFDYQRRHSHAVVNIGGKQVPRVIADFSSHDKIVPADLELIGYKYNVAIDKWYLSDQACDYLYAGKQQLDFAIPGTLSVIVNAKEWKKLSGKERHYPLFSLEEYLSAEEKSDELNFITINSFSIYNLQSTIFNNTVLVFETENEHGMAEQRSMFVELMRRDNSVPVIIKRDYKNISAEQRQLFASTDIGALLLDGFGDGVWMTDFSDRKQETRNKKQINSTLFGILQATRTRISKTEYISCPSCGRTLFDLQETTAKIRSRTNHLKGVKIGIMGCIVNGPGEMADADYGYVGTGVGKITLYKGKEVVQRNVDSERAVEALIELIKQHGDWVETESTNYDPYKYRERIDE